METVEPLTASRERKERFINSFGSRTARDAIEKMFARRGLAMLSDVQIDEVVADLISQARYWTKVERQNRALQDSRDLDPDRRREDRDEQRLLAREDY